MHTHSNKSLEGAQKVQDAENFFRNKGDVGASGSFPAGVKSAIAGKEFSQKSTKGAKGLEPFAPFVLFVADFFCGIADFRES